jgi:hypothetical protein
MRARHFSEPRSRSSAVSRRSSSSRAFVEARS